MPKQSFKVQIDGIELTKSQTAELQKTINAAATSYIAKNFKTLPNDRLWGIRNPEWLGIWIKNFGNLADFKKSGLFKKM
jgi:hypothetical protein